MVLVSAGFAVTAQAAPFVVGNVFASVSNGSVKEFSPTGTLQQTMTSGSGFTTGSAFDAAGNLYVTMFSNGTVAKYNNNGVFQGNFATGLSSPESILIDGAGNVYVGALGNGLKKYDSLGVVQATYAAGRRVDWFDLSADLSVMYYSDEGGSLHRWNLTTNTALTDVCTGGCSDFALRLLGDGTLLSAANTDVKRIRISDGAILQTYDITGVNSFFALNLDPDGTTFWTGSFQNDNLYRFNIGTGTLVTSFNTGGSSSTLYGVSVLGEVCQAGCGGGGTTPEPSSILLLGFGLLGLAFGRRRHTK
jgi:outer membrane protein assembly factor BamB